MKKALTIILSLAVGAALGLLIGSLGRSSASNDASAMSIIIETAGGLVALLIAAYFQIVLHEAGHLVCGLASGYRFVSFRIMSLTLIKDGNGKLRFKRFKLAGTGGQCLMAPPANVAPNDMPTALFNAGGALSNLLWATLALLALLYCSNMSSFFKYFLASTMVVGYAFALLNGIPLKMGGISNDGHNLLYLKHNEQSVKGFYTQLLVNEKLQNGTRLSSMPEELFDLGGDIDYSDPMQANVEILRLQRMIDKGEFIAVHNLLKELNFSHGQEMLQLYRLEMQSDMLFTSLVTGDFEMAKSLSRNKLLMSYITKHAQVMTSKQRVLMAKALILDGNRNEAQTIYDKVVSKRHGYLMQGEVESDIELMKQLLDRENIDQNQAKTTN